MKIVQHAAITEHDEALIESVVEALRLRQDILPPVAHRLADLLAQYVHRNHVNEFRRRRAGQHDPLLAHDPPDDGGVAVLRQDQCSRPVVELPQQRAPPVTLTQYALREVRSFQMLGPLTVEVVDSGMYDLKGVDLVIREVAPGDHDEVDVTVRIEAASGERALQVCGDECVPRASRMPVINWSRTAFSSG